MDPVTICGEVLYYSFRDRTSGLYVGYDGYDTDFKRGISAFITEDQLFTEFNRKLIIKTHDEIEELLTKRSMFDREWRDLGGFDHLEIVCMSFDLEARAFDPLELLQLLNEDATDDDLADLTDNIVTMLDDGVA